MAAPGGLTERPNVAVLKTVEGNLRGFESRTLRQPGPHLWPHALGGRAQSTGWSVRSGADSGDRDLPPGRGTESEPGVPVAPPAPADLRGVPALATVSTSAVADPDCGCAGVVAAVRLAQPGPDRHEAPVAFQRGGLLQHPVQPFGDQQGCATDAGELGEGFLRAPAGQVIATIE